MRYLILATTLILVSGCMHLYKTKKSHSKSSNVVSLYNKGTVCIKELNSNRLQIRYYPLSTNCVSSSIIDWKLLGIDSKVKDSTIYIDTYALYRQKNSKIATADCAGAGVKEKIVTAQADIKALQWGGSRVIIDSKGSSCFQKSKSGIKRVKPFN